MVGKKVVRIAKRKSSNSLSAIHKVHTKLKKIKMSKENSSSEDQDLFQTCMDSSDFETSGIEKTEEGSNNPVPDVINLISDSNDEDGGNSVALIEYEFKAREEIQYMSTAVRRCGIETSGAFAEATCFLSDNFLDMTLADVIERFENPGSFDELLERMANPKFYTSSSKRNTPKTAMRRQPVDKPKMNEAELFEFGRHEAAREMREGEVLYSKNKSPVLVRNSQSSWNGSKCSNIENKTPERGNVARIALYDGNKKIEVDVVLNQADATGEDLKIFDNFISDIKRMPTTVQSKKFQPPRIVPKKSAATKKK